MKVAALVAVAAILFAPVAYADDDSGKPNRDGRGAVSRVGAAAGERAQRSANTQSYPGGRLFKNRLVWVGTPNPTPPPRTVINTFQPLAAVPERLRPAFGWFGDFEFEACALGLSQTTYGQNIVGPYGTSTTAFSRSGCK